MKRDSTRRRFLGNVVGIGGLSVGSTGLFGVASAQSTPEAFVPDRHGFGFRNWSSRRQEFESPREEPSRADIRERITEEWRESARSVLDLRVNRFPDSLVDVMTTQLRGTLVQRAGTNGHCYGMVLAAQRYYEEPELLPLERDSAIEIVHPTEPFDDPSAPVYHDIVTLQAEQFLRFRTWLGRRAMMWPDRIDTDAQLRDIRAVVDTFGTAAISVLNSRLSGHQILVYDYEDRADSCTLSVYDPNYRGEVYGTRRRAIEFEEGDDGLSMRPYGPYTQLLFNRYDRIETSTDRTRATPLDHLDIGTDQVRASLFPLALVTADTANVNLAVSRPNGGRLGRLKGKFMNRSRWRLSRMCYGYGVESGEYRILVSGRRSGEYTLNVRVAEPDGSRLDRTQSARIEAGETHEYVASVPGSAEDEGHLERVTDGPMSWSTAGAVGGGTAAGVGAYHLWNRHRERR